MKPIRLLVLPLAVLLASGCVVQSLQPWLSEESRVTEPSLQGAWHDEEASEAVAFFSDADSADTDYIVTLAGPKDLARFTANLHRIDDTLLLVVGPEERQDAGIYVICPAYLLFKVVLNGDSLKLYPIDLKSFADRAEKAGLALLPDGSRNDGYVLTGSTADSEGFLRAQLADPEFFDPHPLYSFRKLSGEPAAEPPPGQN